jgi:hypothetical protein
MNLIRFILAGLIVFLIIRSFMRYGEKEKPLTSRPDQQEGSKIKDKRISKRMGEYVDYEEVKK